MAPPCLNPPHHAVLSGFIRKKVLHARVHTNRVRGYARFCRALPGRRGRARSPARGRVHATRPASRARAEDEAFAGEKNRGQVLFHAFHRRRAILLAVDWWIPK